MSQHFFPFSCQRRTCLRQFCSCCSILKNFFFYNQTYYKYILFHTDIKISWVIYMGVFSSVQFSRSVMSMDCSTPGFPVHHELPEFAETHAHWVSDAIQPSHPLSSPSHLAFNISQHQGLFQQISSSHQVAKVLEFQVHGVYRWVCICM